MGSLSSSIPDTVPAFEFKGRMLTLTVLRLFTADLEQVDGQLHDTMIKAPDFFRGMPVLLDFEPIGEGTAGVDLVALTRLLRGQGLQPVGVRAGDDALAAAASEAGLGVFELSGQGAVRRVERAQEPAAVPEPLIVRQPVRSGQQVYARDRDLVVLAQVSPGAEVLADGSIHVYGTLRGRALAGVQGNVEARIFCTAFDPELISIAGNYQISEQLSDAVRGRPAQVYLQEEVLSIEPI